MSRTTVVIFDVDFTLIHPGPRFQAAGYEASCAKHSIPVDPALFDHAVAGASGLLRADDHVHDAQIFIDYTRRIIELMGGTGPDLDRVAREIYDDWAVNDYFTLYDDVVGTLVLLAARGLRVGLISNGHRRLDAFQSHFALDGLIAAAVSSSDHGFMKPHPSIFREALGRLGVSAREAVMVGDSLAHDIHGARDAGMRAILLDRAGTAPPFAEVPVIRSLTELMDVI